MLILKTALTPALEAWLSAANDPGEPPLWVYETTSIAGSPKDEPAVRVLRKDGSEPSEREHREILALLAAHAIAPLSPPKQG